LGKSGALEPSLFSGIGHTNTEQIGPRCSRSRPTACDGEEYSGTSFATPFIAALYSAFADYNIKNVIEESSRFTPLASGLVATEKSRFGVPDGRLILGNACSKSNKIANIRQSIEGTNLVICFELSRNCMEKIDYFMAAYLSGQKAISKRVLAPDQLRVAGKNATLRGFERKHSAERNIVAEPIEIKIPLKNIPREQFGIALAAKIKIATKAQLAPVSLVSSLSDITFTLPDPAPYPDDVVTPLNPLDPAVGGAGVAAHAECVLYTNVSSLGANGQPTCRGGDLLHGHHQKFQRASRKKYLDFCRVVA